ncbi:unnamed protein product [Brassica napus]|uniref:(rape) hypothetical protein n=1 Tax=Brassica napus TaxID=3708 RepID=A0A816M9G5_BRANA|nr:unnamed protein product [Brassica napus]
MTSTPTPSATNQVRFVLEDLQTKRMDIPELPRSKLHTALREALTDDEFEEFKDSSLGVFIKFKEQGFGWASRLVHYMLSFKLDIKKKYEMWSLVGPEPLRFSLLEFENLTGLNCEYIEDLETPKCDVTQEMVSFRGMLGVHLEAGPTTDQIIAALKRCGIGPGKIASGSRASPSSLDSLKEKVFNRYTIYSGKASDGFRTV